MELSGIFYIPCYALLNLDKMKTLKVKELKEGCIYWCNLSDRKVLVTSIQEKTTELPDGKKVDYTECNAIAYSGNGMYDSVIVWDNMLSLTSN